MMAERVITSAAPEPNIIKERDAVRSTLEKKESEIGEGDALKPTGAKLPTHGGTGQGLKFQRTADLVLIGRVFITRQGRMDIDFRPIRLNSWDQTIQVGLCDFSCMKQSIDTVGIANAVG